MQRFTMALVGVLGTLAVGATLTGLGASGATAATETEMVGSAQPRAICEARRVGQDVEVTARLQLTDSELDVTADNALAVVDLGTTSQARPLVEDVRSEGTYFVVFDRLPADVPLNAIEIWASPSPDDPGSFRCNSTSTAGGPVLDPDGNLPRSGG